MIGLNLKLYRMYRNYTFALPKPKRPITKVTIKIAKNNQKAKRNIPILADADETPPKPKTPAIRDMIKNVIDNLSI